MLSQSAQVVALAEGEVQLAIHRRSACAGCQQSQACGVSTIARYFSTSSQQTLWLPTELELAVGDWVELELPEEAMLWASVRVYLVPLLCGMSLALLATSLVPSAFSDLAALLGLLLGVGLSLRRSQRQGRLAGQSVLRIAAKSG